MKCEIIIEKLMGHATEGKIGKFHIECGDVLSHGDAICTIESGKGTVKCESAHAGKLIEILASEGDAVKVGDIIGYIDSDGTSSSANMALNEKKNGGYSFGLAKPRREELEPDLLVVGGGPGGYVAAIRGAQLGLEVVLIEKDELGGTCLNYGCIPTKTLAHTAHVLELVKEAYEYGIETSGAVLNMGSAIARKDRVVKTLTGGVSHLLESAGVRVVRGNATAVDSSTFEVKTSKVDLSIIPKKTILAMGSSPWKLQIEGADLPGVLTSKEILDLDVVPESITIIGGGVIGMEFAFIMNSFGAQVSVVEYQEDILAMLDSDIVDLILAEARKKGINILTGVCAKRIMSSNDGTMILEYLDGEESHYVTSEIVLMATGRKPNLDSMDLEKLDIDLNEGQNGVKVNTSLETSQAGIYAIGDLTNIIQLAHVASHQGMVAAEHAAGLEAVMSYDNVPSAIFTDPEIGTVGISEKEAFQKNIPVNVSRFYFAGNGKALAMNKTEGFVKLIAHKEDNRVIGGAIVGVHGTDMLPAIVHLIEHKISIEDASHTIYAHPTAAESIHEALLGLKGRALHAV